MQYRHHNLTEREKAYRRRTLGLKKPFSADNPAPAVKKVREYLAPVKPSHVPTVRGRTGCKLSSAKRLMVQQKSAQRREFFASLGVEV